MDIKKYFDLFASTAPINREKVELLITEAYVSQGHQPPVFIHVRGPLEANRVNDMLEELPNSEADQAPALAAKMLSKPGKPKKMHVDGLGGGSLAAGAFLGQEKYFEDYPEKLEELKKNKKQHEEYNLFLQIGFEANLWWQWERVVVCTDRPVFFAPTLKPDNSVFYHNANGPVIAWGDGYAQYYLNDVRVPEWLVNTAPEDLTIEHFLNQKNLEVRREVARKIGWPRLIKKFKGTLIDEWRPGLAEIEYAHKPGVPVSPYRLYAVNIPLPDNQLVVGYGLWMELEDKDNLTSEYFEFVRGKFTSAKEAFFSNRPGVPSDRKILLS